MNHLQAGCIRYRIGQPAPVTAVDVLLDAHQNGGPPAHELAYLFHFLTTFGKYQPLVSTE